MVVWWSLSFILNERKSINLSVSSSYVPSLPSTGLSGLSIWVRMLKHTIMFLIDYYVEICMEMFQYKLIELLNLNLLLLILIYIFCSGQRLGQGGDVMDKQKHPPSTKHLQGTGMLYKHCSAFFVFTLIAPSLFKSTQIQSIFMWEQ